MWGLSATLHYDSVSVKELDTLGVGVGETSTLTTWDMRTTFFPTPLALAAHALSQRDRKALSAHQLGAKGTGVCGAFHAKLLYSIELDILLWSRFYLIVYKISTPFV